MLLNLSNHPSAKWPPDQMQTATQQYGSIEDLPFPQINPHWSADQVVQLAEQYYIQIRQLDPFPTAVHLMGELTFTFALVTKLKAAGISCVASTTERIVNFEQNGNKHSTFRFIHFRQY